MMIKKGYVITGFLMVLFVLSIYFWVVGRISVFALVFFGVFNTVLVSAWIMRTKTNSLLKIILLAVLIGIFGSFISLVYMQNLTPFGTVGAAIYGYGFPSIWLKKTVIVYPGSPTRYYLIVEGLLTDMAFFSFVAGVPISILSYLLHRWFGAGKTHTTSMIAYY